MISRDQKQAYRVTHVTGGCRHIFEKVSRTPSETRNLKSKFTEDCMYIDFDDTEFGPTSAEIEIAPYSGKRNVLSLDVYPIAMVRKNAAQKLEETIVARGKKFVKLTNVEHKRYTGLSIKKKSRRYEDVCRS